MIKEVKKVGSKIVSTYTVKINTNELKEMTDDIKRTIGTGKTIKVTVTK